MSLTASLYSNLQLITVKVESSMGYYLLELAWEVGLVKGGTYTYLWGKSKALSVHRQGRHMLIGPYFAESYGTEITPIDPPAEFARLTEIATELNLKIYFGTWAKAGNVLCLLVDYSNLQELLLMQQSISQDLAEHYGVKNEYTNVPLNWEKLNSNLVLWTYYVGKLLERALSAGQWSAEQLLIDAHYPYGVALLLLQNLPAEIRARIATVRTLHATHLGYLSTVTSAQKWQSYLRNPNFTTLAEYFNSDEFTIEAAEIRQADYVNAVSAATYAEVDRFYYRKPEFLMPHGFDKATFDEVLKQPKPQPDNDSLMANALLTTEDLSKKVIHFFSAGRDAEFIKGYELIIAALGELDKHLQQPEFANLVVVQNFYILVYRQEDIERFKQKLEQGVQPLNFINYYCQQAGLFNSQSNKVKINLVPRFGHQAQNLEYFQTIRQSQLALFPSLYEPWGYTPVEASAVGVPTVTTNAGGFGQYLLETNKPEDLRGIKVLNLQQSKTAVITALAEHMLMVVSADTEALADLGKNARELVSKTDWGKMIGNYLQNYEQAARQQAK